MRLEPRREQSAAPRASYRLSSGTANPPVSAWNPSPFFTSAGWAGKAQACRGRGALSSRAGSPGLRFGCPDKGGLIPPPEESDPPRPGSPGSRPQVHGSRGRAITRTAGLSDVPEALSDETDFPLLALQTGPDAPDSIGRAIRRLVSCIFSAKQMILKGVLCSWKKPNSAFPSPSRRPCSIFWA